MRVEHFKEEKYYKITFVCSLCGKEHVMYLEEADYEKYVEGQQNGEVIQHIFPDMNPCDREKFLSEFCEDCQNLIFGKDEE